MREERRLRVFENWVLRGIFGPKRDEVTVNGENYIMRSLVICTVPKIFRVIKSRRMRWEGHVARMGERRCAYRILVGKPERKRPLGRPRCRREDNIKMDLQEEGLGGMDWIVLSQNIDRWRTLVNAVMNLRVPSNEKNFLSS